MQTSKPVQPAAPCGMEFVFYYECPYCGAHIGTLSPVQPGMLSCGRCGKSFPVIPVEERSLQYIRLMTGNGQFMADADFL